MQAYGPFADVYDAVMDDFDYPKWAEYYWSLLGRAGVHPKALVEAGCGTGSMTVELAKYGARVIGADLSEEMLRRASEKLRRAGVQAQLIRQDMCKLSVPRPVDAVIAPCDAVNYLTTLPRVRAFFESAHAAIRPGGALAFDVSSRYKLEVRMGSAFFGEERDEIAYLWENRLDADTHLIHMDLTFFVREPDGRYRRFQEEHLQRAHGEGEILELLSASGFSDVEVFGDRTLDSPGETELRLHFLARRT